MLKIRNNAMLKIRNNAMLKIQKHIQKQCDVKN